MHVRILLLTVGVAAFTISALGQTSSPYGTEFLLTFPDTAIAHVGPFSPYTGTDARLTLFSLDTSHVTITAGTYTRTITVYPQTSTTVSVLDSSITRPFVNVPDTILASAIEVTSDRPISIICWFYSPNGSEAFVPLPVSAWGKEYFAMTLRNGLYFHAGNRGDLEENIYPDYAPSQIVLIAAENGTDVTINATTPTRRFTDTTIRLDRGDVYLIESHDPWTTTDTLSRDLSGTRITSSRPIGVMSGNTRSSGGFGGIYITLPTGNTLTNTLIEWLTPSPSTGNTFVYRPIFTRSNERTQELIRLYATAPGTTSVAVSNGFPVKTIQQGQFLQYSFCADPALALPAGAFSAPFALRTDKPAAAMVVTASLSELGGLLPDSSSSYLTWSPAMSRVVPREEWITYGRFHAPTAPMWMEHSVAIVADSGATVWVDTTMVAFELTPVPGTPFVHALVNVSSGDHAIRSSGGRFGAVASGIIRGSEEFRPVENRKEGDATILHPSYYIQVMSNSYAYPVLGLDESEAPIDSIELDIVERCDSIVVVLRRVGEPWLMGPIRTEILPDSVNADVTIESDFQGGVPVGYRIRFAAVDPDASASAHLRITGSSGRIWDIPLSRPAPSIAISPLPIALLDVPVGVEKSLDLTLTNQRSFVVTVLNARLLGGVPQFSLRGIGTLPKPLLPSQSVPVTVAFIGTTKNTSYADSLLIETTCGAFVVPVRGRVGPDPMPTITGYDWHERKVGTAHDTLSLIGNVGSRAYRITSVTIVDDPSGAFSLIPPAASTTDSVVPGVGTIAGIRFTPPTSGDFNARVVMATDDRDTVDAPLHGVGLLPRILLATLVVDTLCVDSTHSVLVDLVNVSAVAAFVDGISIRPSPQVRVTIDTIPPFLPIVIPAGSTARLPVTITPLQVGPYTVTLSASGDVSLDTIAIAGLVTSCMPPDLIVTDHDFDSVFITLEREGSVWVKNLGGGNITVTGMDLVEDTSSSFRILWPTPPFDVPDTGEVEVRCVFGPMTVGTKTAAIDYETRVGPRRSLLRGVGKKLQVPALIRRDYHAAPGEGVTIHLELMGRLDTLPVSTMEFAIGYDTGLLDYLTLDVPRATDSAWRWFGDRDGDSIRCHIAFGTRPPAPDTLVSMRHLVRLSTIDSSELPFRATVDLPYVDIVPSPGLFRRDPFCGLEERLFEFTASTFRLDQNVPNPFNRSTTIGFELPFDNPTTLLVYDTYGSVALRLIDGPLPAGVHSTTTPDGALPSGVYYYRLTSGPFAATRRMIVE